MVNSDGPTSIPGDIATAMNERNGVNVGLVAWFDDDTYRGRTATDVHALDMRSEVPVWDGIRQFADIAAQYDVIHTHHAHSGSIARVVGKLRGKIVVSTENAAHGRLSDIGSVSTAATNLLADAIVCVSGAVRDSFGRWEAPLTGHKVSIIYNGIDVDAIDECESDEWNLSDHVGIADDSFVLGHAGSLKPVKSQRTLIEATHEIVANGGEDIEVVIAGDGPLRVELEELARTLGVDDCVHFLGELERSRVYRLMYSIDGFVMPSRDEAFCVAVAEAMATGTPCVLSDIPVFHEVYDDAALFHTVGDHLDLADKMTELQSETEVRRRLSRKGDQLVRSNYSIEFTVDEYLDLYDTLLE